MSAPYTVVDLVSGTELVETDSLGFAAALAIRLRRVRPRRRAYVRFNMIGGTMRREMTYHVEQVDKFDPTDWEWAIVEADGSIIDRYETEQDALDALPTYAHA